MIFKYLTSNLIYTSLNQIILTDCQYFRKDKFTPQEYFKRSSGNLIQVRVKPSNQDNPVKTQTDHESDQSKKKEESLPKLSKTIVLLSKCGTFNSVAPDSQNDDKSDSNAKEIMLLNENKMNNFVISHSGVNKTDIHIIQEKVRMDLHPNLKFSPSHSRMDDSSFLVTKKKILNDPNHQTTEKDYKSLQSGDYLIYDDRPFWRYFFSCLLDEHPLLSTFFKKSLLEPAFIRVLLLIFNISLTISLNALLFIDSYIDIRADNPDKRVKCEY